MDKSTVDILSIIKSAITNQAINISESFQLNELLDIANKHKVLTMVYYGMHNCNIKIDKDIKKRLFLVVMNEVLINEKQSECINTLSKLFCENNIDHIFLKGTMLRNLYPKSEIRRMGDIDILIKRGQYDKISKVLKNLGFSFKYESNHEIVWYKNDILIELHKILMPSYNKDLHSYFGNGWKRAVVKEHNSYTFSNEDMLIYIFSHFAKHYRDAGIGITHMCDLFLFLNSTKLNFDYVYAELKKLQLYDFFCNIKNTLDVWFCNREANDITEHITRVILNSGVYGLHENVILSSAIKENKKFDNMIIGKTHRVFCKIFPSYDGMKRKYQILKRIPLLLPLFWGIRLINILLMKRKNIKGQLSDILSVDMHKVNEYEKNLKYVGLDYNF